MTERLREPHLRLIQNQTEVSKLPLIGNPLGVRATYSTSVDFQADARLQLGTIREQRELQRAQRRNRLQAIANSGEIILTNPIEL